MNLDQTVEKLRVLFATANELSNSDLPMVRQRAEAVVGLVSELMVTVAGDEDWRIKRELVAE